jgi:hypothetical protein
MQLGTLLTGKGGLRPVRFWGSDPKIGHSSGDLIGRIRNGRFGVSNGDKQMFVHEYCRRQVPTGAVMARTAVGSVGETTANSANATARGTAGIIQLMKKPIPTTVRASSPSDSSRIGFRMVTVRQPGGRRSPW